MSLGEEIEMSDVLGRETFESIYAGTPGRESYRLKEARKRHRRAVPGLPPPAVAAEAIKE